MRVLVHALGCKVFGSKYVFDSLMEAVPPEIEVTAIAPGPSELPDATRPNVHYHRLPHRLFGQLLRPAVEVAVTAAAGLGPYDGLINLSNYGLCWSSNQVLYFHNPMILENRTRGFGEGRSDPFKRYCLKTCLRGARTVFVQTEHMRGSVEGLCADWGLDPPTIGVLRPPVRFGNSASKASQYPFQLFYPASDFAHKRTSLAIEGAALAAGRTPDVGLVITGESGRTTPAGIIQLGWISREEVGAEYSAASALLFTSEAETLGLPLLEALDRGLPAVLPDLPYARELYGEAAVYFGDPTAESVCEAILKLKNEIVKYRELASKRRQEARALETSWPDHWRAFLEAIHPKAAVDV